MSRSVSPDRSMYPSQPGGPGLSFPTAAHMSDKIGEVSPGPVSASNKIRRLPRSEARRQDKSFSSGKRWSGEEDEVLCELGDKGESFAVISERLPGRSKAACQARYHDVLAWTRDYWSEAEEQSLIAMMQAGASFQHAADLLPGRAATKIKYHWEHLKDMAREQLSREEYEMFLPRSRNHENDHEDRIENDTELESEAFNSKPRHDVPSRAGAIRRLWTYQEKKVLLSLRARGENWVEISRQLPGRSPDACIKCYRRLGKPRTTGPTRIWRIWEPVIVQDLTDGIRRSEDEAPDPLRVYGPKENSFVCTLADNTCTESGVLNDMDMVDRAAQADDNDGELENGNKRRSMTSSDVKPNEDSKAISAEDRPWTDREVQAILYLREMGKTFEDISLHLTHRTPQACEMRYFWCLHLRRNAIKGTPTMPTPPAMQKPKTEVWLPKDEGSDLLTGLCSGGEGLGIELAHGANDMKSHTSDMDGRSDDYKTEYFSIDGDNTNTIKHESSDPTINDANEEDAFYTPQPHAIPETQLVPLAQRVLHQHLVAQGEERIKRNALQQGRYTQSAEDNHKSPDTYKLVEDRCGTLQHHESMQSPDIPPTHLPTREQGQEQEGETTKARHDALEHLRRMYPPQATHGSTTSTPSTHSLPTHAPGSPTHGHTIPRVDIAELGADRIMHAVYRDDHVREDVLSGEDRPSEESGAKQYARGECEREAVDRDGDGRVGAQADGQFIESRLSEESEEEDIEEVYRKWGLR